MVFSCFVRKPIPRLPKSTLLHLDTAATVRLTPRRCDAIMTSTRLHFSCPVCCNRWGFILQYRWILLKPAPKFLLVGPWTAYLVHGYRRAHVRKIFCLVCADAQKFANFVVALQNLLLSIHIRTRPFYCTISRFSACLATKASMSAMRQTVHLGVNRMPRGNRPSLT